MYPFNEKGYMEVQSSNHLTVRKNVRLTKFMIYLLHRSAQTLQQIELVQENLGYKLLDLLKFKLTFKEYISLLFPGFWTTTVTTVNCQLPAE